MSRTRASAKQAGSKWEKDVAEYLDSRLSGMIERRVRNGSKDRGDISGVQVFGDRVVIECKDYGGKYEVSTWLTEADVECENDNAAIGVVAAKRRGKGNAGDGVVMMTLDAFTWLLEKGER